MSNVDENDDKDHEAVVGREFSTKIGDDNSYSDNNSDDNNDFDNNSSNRGSYYDDENDD